MMGPATACRFGVSLVLVLVYMTSSVKPQCTMEPEFWCIDEQTARSCHVLSQCEAERKVMLNKQVEIVLYYESLCGDCKKFIVDQLYPTYIMAGDIMNITLIPYGFVFEQKFGKNYVQFCQHGKEECIGNRVEVCAMDRLKEVPRYMPFIYCLEANATYFGDYTKTATACGMQLKLEEFPSIIDCALSHEGLDLLHEMGQKFNANPAPQKTGVPYFEINGYGMPFFQLLGSKDLLRLVCRSYWGKKPLACPIWP